MITCTKLLQPLTWLCACFFVTTASSQALLTDSLQPADARVAIKTFQQDLLSNKEVYSGPEHIFYLQKIEGQAYFQSNQWVLGAVNYNNVLYENEWLLYDLVKDNVVLKRKDGFPIELRSEKVSYFKFPTHVFVNITQTDSLGLVPGFYEQLARGALSIFVKHEKKLDEKVEETQIRQRFLESTTYYAVKGNRAYVIRNLKNVLALLEKDRGEVEQSLRRSGIKYKQNPALALATIATVYNKNHN